MTHSQWWHDSFSIVTWLVLIRDMKRRGGFVPLPRQRLGEFNVFSIYQMTTEPVTNVTNENGSWGAVMSRMRMGHEEQSCHEWEWVMSRMSFDLSEFGYGIDSSRSWWVMSRTKISHGTNDNESCHEGVLTDLSLDMALIAVRHDESCHERKWVMRSMKISMSHGQQIPLFSFLVTNENESCHMSKWVMTRMRMSRITRVNESCHTHEWVMSRMRMSHVICTNESCHRGDDYRRLSF